MRPRLSAFSWTEGLPGYRTRRIARVLVPPAAQCPVEIDEVGQALQASGDDGELRVVGVGLRREHREIVVHAVPIAEIGQLESPLLRRRVSLERGELVVIGAARREPVRDFAEG